ncbi:MAG: MFS transporter [Acidobacteria bacterium]|nr:MFS transporter [Acidobacteriota bacterium]
MHTVCTKDAKSAPGQLPFANHVSALGDAFFNQRLAEMRRHARALLNHLHAGLHVSAADLVVIPRGLRAQHPAARRRLSGETAGFAGEPCTLILLHRFRNWIPAGSMMLVSLISYIDRNTLALLAPTMLAELKLSNEQYGWVLSGFSVAYMIGNLLWGRWIDRFGLRWAMTAAVGFWTLASSSHALTLGFASLFLARTALGFGEGATFPGGLRTVVQTLPPAQRARGVAVAYSGGALGALITPIIMTRVFGLWGWRGAFWFTGLIGLLWVLLWRRIHVPAHTTTETSANRPSWRDPRFWAFACSYAFGSAPLGFVLYYAPLYLKVLGKTQIELGDILWIPPVGWEIGYYVWGWWIDRTVAKAGFSVRSYRGLFTGLMLLSLLLGTVPFVSSFPLAMFLLFFAMFIASGFIIGTVSYATTAFGHRDSGFLAGLGAGSWSALVAVLTPLAGRLFDQHNYHAAFLISALFPCVGWAIWMALANLRSTCSIPK